MELQHFDQGEIGAHVAVQYEEIIGIAAPDLVAKVVQAASCAQRRVLLQVPAIAVKKCRNLTIESLFSDWTEFLEDFLSFPPSPRQELVFNSILTTFFDVSRARRFDNPNIILIHCFF